MKKFILGLALVFGLLFAQNSFAALAAVDVSLGDQDVNEINRMNPNASKTFLGDRLKGPLTTGATTYGSTDNINTASAGNYATPTTTVFLKTTGASVGTSYWLGNGTYNQRLTAILVTDGGQDFLITPQTKTGFTSVQLNDAKDTVTLRYINDTVGWTIEGNNGTTIN